MGTGNDAMAEKVWQLLFQSEGIFGRGSTSRTGAKSVEKMLIFGNNRNLRAIRRRIGQVEFPWFNIVRKVKRSLTR
jgi:hypothetical protein